MTKMRRLATEARASAEFRGHTLGKFKWSKPGKHRYGTAHCTKCDRWVNVVTVAMPNEIEIGGPAIAVHCQ